MSGQTEQRPFVPERAQEAGGSRHAGPLRIRARRLPAPMKRVLNSRVVQLATTPHGPEPYLQMVNPLWSLSSTQALLVDRRRETHDVTTLVFDPGPEWGPHEAGQHVRIDIDIDGRRHTRYFTISSTPTRDDGLLTVTVKGHADGHVSRFLQTHARPGLVVELSQPRGEFVLPTPRPQRLLLVTGGSGITPAMSMLRSLLDEGARCDVVFLHYTRSPDDRIFAAELDRLAAAHDDLTMATVYSDHPPQRDEPTGHLDRTHLDQLCPDWTQRPAYVCGPPPMLDVAEQVWQDAGAGDRFHLERFTLQVPAGDEDAAAGVIRLRDSDLELANDGRPLLIQAEDAGLTPEYGCRMGICKTCTVRKHTGTTQNLTTGAVSRDDDQDIQICVNVALTDAELQL